MPHETLLPLPVTVLGHDMPLWLLGGGGARSLGNGDMVSKVLHPGSSRVEPAKLRLG